MKCTFLHPVICKKFADAASFQIQGVEIGTGLKHDSTKRANSDRNILSLFDMLEIPIFECKLSAHSITSTFQCIYFSGSMQPGRGGKLFEFLG